MFWDIQPAGLFYALSELYQKVGDVDFKLFKRMESALVSHCERKLAKQN